MVILNQGNLLMSYCDRGTAPSPPHSAGTHAACTSSCKYSHNHSVYQLLSVHNLLTYCSRCWFENRDLRCLCSNFLSSASRMNALAKPLSVLMSVIRITFRKS